MSAINVCEGYVLSSTLSHTFFAWFFVSSNTLVWPYDMCSSAGIFLATAGAIVSFINEIVNPYFPVSSA